MRRFTQRFPGDRVEARAAFAESRGREIVDLAFAWPRSRSVVSSVIEHLSSRPLQQPLLSEHRVQVLVHPLPLERKALPQVAFSTHP